MMRNQDKWFLLLIGGGILLLIFGCHPVYASPCHETVYENGDVIRDCGDVVSIYGKADPNDLDLWYKRQAEIKAGLDKELQRKHELELKKMDVEIAKHSQPVYDSGVSDLAYLLGGGSGGDLRVTQRVTQTNRQTNNQRTTTRLGSTTQTQSQ